MGPPSTAFRATAGQISKLCGQCFCCKNSTTKATLADCDNSTKVIIAQIQATDAETALPSRRFLHSARRYQETARPKPWQAVGECWRDPFKETNVASDYYDKFASRSEILYDCALVLRKGFHWCYCSRKTELDLAGFPTAEGVQ